MKGRYGTVRRLRLSRRNYFIRYIFIMALLTMLAGYLGGCMSKSKNIVSYMEERYGTTFTYLGETNGMLGGKSFTARLSCQEFPDAVILASGQKRDGKMYYADNYMAYRFHEKAFQKIDGAVRQVFAEYGLFFKVPDVLLAIENPDGYTLEDYLADPLSFKSVYILVREDVDEIEVQGLMTAFQDASISVQGLAAVPENWIQAAGVTEESIEDYLANPERVRTQVNFVLENGKLKYMKWRQ